MRKISERLIIALESIDACELENIIKDKRADDFEDLLSLLSMDDSINSIHRTNAIYALGRWGDPTVVDKIQDILPCLDETERIGAIDALGRLGTKEALESILKYLDDPSPNVRKFVTHALGRINTPKARIELKEIKVKDPNEMIRSTAARYLDN